ncbi:4-alpha-glucanotransferase [Desulfohalotomaculum tongense]|uniref:glycoside hydrolase family 13 protein n=1 Tax=Desulforadius tongensis TaxID=1216062 RepID=UPI001EE628A8|nr:glycoside hydrolase family 13 protein [Desulforadius tongensis]MBM7854150.1 4-alpha-glucanotransferase [Desulforadius tongensis]
MQLSEDDDNKKIYQGEIITPSTPGLLWYFFIIHINGKTFYYGNNADNFGGIGQIYKHQPPSYQVTVYKEDLSVPHWFKESVMYQIFVDRFYNGHDGGQMLNPKQKCYVYNNWHDTPYYRTDPDSGKTVCYDFFGGNLLGVIKKLSYLKELGINIIYFNPVFEAPSNHKYDTANYKKIDPMFGDNMLFKELCSKAKEMGISIILDGVFSHTGSDSIYFNKEGTYPEIGAYQSKESPYYSWYKFYDWPHRYECWWGIDTLPNVNEMDPSYQNFIIYDQDSVLKYWMKMGIKGWRLDVVDELPDEFVKRLRKEMKKLDPESVLIGEVWEDASNKISYGKMREYLLGDELDSVMNYPFRNILLDFILNKRDVKDIHRAFMSLYENYPLEHFYSTMNLVGSHDVPRVLTILGEAPAEENLSKEEQGCYKLPPDKKKLAIERLKLVSLFQMTFPGVPCIYYGDEAEMEGYGDPLCRATYPWGRENRQLLNWYKKIIALRRQHDVLKTGRWVPLNPQGDFYGYLRLIENGKDVFGQNKKDNAAVVLFNRHPKEKIDLTIDLSRWCNGILIDVLQEGRKFHLKDGRLNVLLKPLEGKLLMSNVSALE